MTSPTDLPTMPADAVRFTEREPAAPFLWLYRNVDGTVAAYPTELDDYRRHVARYGVPGASSWRYGEPVEVGSTTPTHDRERTRT